jgi:hypothetical protein
MGYLKEIDVQIDKLTNSIENTTTGEVFDTEIVRVSRNNKRLLRKSDWKFDWHVELEDDSKEVFKLTTTNNPDIIQGLISIEDKTDHIFMHLIESSKFNIGKNKIYLGVPGNLVAYACKTSMERGYEGFVAFDAKTVLIRHYQETLFATHFRGNRMFIDTRASTKLIFSYFKQ